MQSSLRHMRARTGVINDVEGELHDNQLNRVRFTCCWRQHCKTKSCKLDWKNIIKVRRKLIRHIIG